MNKRHNNVVSLAQRRAAAGVKHAARSRYERLAANFDRHGPDALRTKVERPGTERHSIVLQELDGKFVASCACGEWRSKPMGAPYAKGAHTRHVKAAMQTGAVTPAA
ncbi:hypothetical protein C8D87_114130 [Lentzea atacamensis]|uniref:HNH endonuclease n=1 Tax=Lentzea atacamensis TaxID=531938 RepID=A0ABX9DXS2_9PSEU|nr:hypothetical protein [Lentzea atacamensis]RAS59518.1 hypothetical protein C8D87_114130 [Lentzea atacamensis]